MIYRTESGNGRTIHRAICYRCKEILKHSGSMAQKYCPECKKIIDRERAREGMRKYRERNKKGVSI